MPKRAPKEWWDRKTKEVRAGLKKAHPKWADKTLDDQTRKTVGNLWFNELSDAKRKEILEEAEGNPHPKNNPKGDKKGSVFNDLIMPFVIGSITLTIVVIILFWLKVVALKRNDNGEIDQSCKTGGANFVQVFNHSADEFRIQFISQLDYTIHQAIAFKVIFYSRLDDWLSSGQINTIQYDCASVQFERL